MPLHICDASCRTMDGLIPGLYIGSLLAAKDKELMKQSNITRIVSLGTDLFFPEDFRYKHVDVLDMESVNIIRHFEDCIQFIEGGDSEDSLSPESACLVHCVYGQSRSATICLAFLMKKHSHTLASALQLLRNRRPCIEINPGFLRQLQLYERMGMRLRGESTHHAEYRRLCFASALTSSSFASPPPRPRNLSRSLQFIQEHQQQQHAPIASCVRIFNPKPRSGGGGAAHPPSSSTTATACSGGGGVVASSSLTPPTVTSGCGSADSVIPPVPVTAPGGPPPPSLTAVDTTVSEAGSATHAASTVVSDGAVPANTTTAEKATDTTTTQVTATSTAARNVVVPGIPPAGGDAAGTSTTPLPSPSTVTPPPPPPPRRRAPSVPAVDSIAGASAGTATRNDQYTRFSCSRCSTLLFFSTNQLVHSPDPANPTTSKSATSNQSGMPSGSSLCGGRKGGGHKTGGKPGSRKQASSSSSSSALASSSTTVGGKMSKRGRGRGGACKEEVTKQGGKYGASGNQMVLGGGRGAGGGDGGGTCSSYFVEPMDWMLQETVKTAGSGGSRWWYTTRSGKLLCPSVSCGQKLGAWNLDGLNCSCGVVVQPAFQVIRSRVFGRPEKR